MGIPHFLIREAGAIISNHHITNLCAFWLNNEQIPEKNEYQMKSIANNSTHWTLPGSSCGRTLSGVVGQRHGNPYTFHIDGNSIQSPNEVNEETLKIKSIKIFYLNIPCFSWNLIDRWFSNADSLMAGYIDFTHCSIISKDVITHLLEADISKYNS